MDDEVDEHHRSRDKISLDPDASSSEDDEDDEDVAGGMDIAAEDDSEDETSDDDETDDEEDAPNADNLIKYMPLDICRSLISGRDRKHHHLLHARARNPEMARCHPFAHAAPTREADLQI